MHTLYTLPSTTLVVYMRLPLSLTPLPSYQSCVYEQIRTPLSTASMGLELLNLMASKQLQSSTKIPIMDKKKTTVSSRDNKKINDEHDVLWLVQESIRVAVGVFDHLIQYDALDHNDDEMALHYQPINAASMMSAVIAPMKLEAQRKEVVLLGNLVDLRRLSPTAFSATVEVDERRIAQCIRSLVSGAIALTPKVQGFHIVHRINLLISTLSHQASHLTPIQLFTPSHIYPLIYPLSYLPPFSSLSSTPPSYLFYYKGGSVAINLQLLGASIKEPMGGAWMSGNRVSGGVTSRKGGSGRGSEGASVGASKGIFGGIFKVKGVSATSQSTVVVPSDTVDGETVVNAPRREHYVKRGRRRESLLDPPIPGHPLPPPLLL